MGINLCLTDASRVVGLGQSYPVPLFFIYISIYNLSGILYTYVLRYRYWQGF